VGPRKSPAYNAFNDEVVGGTGRPDAHSQVELPLRTEIHIDGGEELLLLISQRIKSGQ